MKKLLKKILMTVIAGPLVVAAAVGYTAGVAVTSTELGKTFVKAACKAEYGIDISDEDEE